MYLGWMIHHRTSIRISVFYNFLIVLNKTIYACSSSSYNRLARAYASR